MIGIADGTLAKSCSYKKRADERLFENDGCGSNGDVLQRFKAGGADQLSFVIRNVVAVLAEDAGGSVLLENDFVGVDVNFQGILGADVENVADLLGENDSAK